MSIFSAARRYKSFFELFATAFFMLSYQTEETSITVHKGAVMKEYIARLRERGYKLTPRRKAIVATFIECNSHLTPEAVWQRLRKDFARCGLPGVYRNLESLVECGVLTRIQQFDRKKHYALCTAARAGHHHHITCIQCGKVDAITECALGHKKKLKGYTVMNHYMQVNGICGECART
jgi:Fur family transcriptional regulator, ferric uptake regulator